MGWLKSHRYRYAPHLYPPHPGRKFYSAVAQPLLQHKQTLDAVVTSETTEPTFEESGRTIYSAFVTFGGNVYSTGEEDSKTTVLPPIGYEWADPEYEWADDNSSVTATRRSTNAPDHQITETVDTMIRVTQPATCEEDGTMLYIADFENAVFETQTKEAVMPATGHKYNYTEFEWTEGLSAATAVFTCENDSTHIIKVNAVITPIVTPPTCTLTGTLLCPPQGYFVEFCSFRNSAYHTVLTEQ